MLGGCKFYVNVVTGDREKSKRMAEPKNFFDDSDEKFECDG